MAERRCAMERGFVTIIELIDRSAAVEQATDLVDVSSFCGVMQIPHRLAAVLET